MTTVYRVTALFQVTTDPVDRSVANPHTGGWSESWWTTLTGAPLRTAMSQLFRYRSALLPAGASIVGSRRGTFTITGNKLVPGPSLSAEEIWPGVAAYPTGQPQDALQIKGYGSATNRNSFFLRAMPYQFIVGGEYAPSRGFSTALTAFLNFLGSGQWGFVGRDLSQQSQRVVQITPTTDVPLGQSHVFIAAALAGAAAGTYVRFSRVYDSTGKPITGAYINFLAPAGTQLTVFGLGQRAVLAPSGTVRTDLLIYTPYTSLNYNRAGVKKVGRPSEGYRGRRSA
jgi:hypothetical protein